MVKKILPFNPHEAARIALNIGGPHRSIVYDDNRDMRRSFNKPFRNDKLELDPSERMEANENTRVKRKIREIREFIAGFIILSAAIFTHDLLDLGRSLTHDAGVSDFWQKFAQYLSSSVQYPGNKILQILPFETPILAVSVTILLVVSILVYLLMYGTKRSDDAVDFILRLFASFVVAMIFILTISRLLVLFENLETSNDAPRDHLTIYDCPSGFKPATFEQPRYLRLNPNGSVVLGEAEVTFVADPNSPPLTMSDDGDFGLVKRNDNVKPVAPIDAAGPAKAEPAYLSVRLCIRENETLPATISADVGGRL